MYDGTDEWTKVSETEAKHLVRDARQMKPKIGPAPARNSSGPIPSGTFSMLCQFDIVRVSRMPIWKDPCGWAIYGDHRHPGDFEN